MVIWCSTLIIEELNTSLRERRAEITYLVLHFKYESLKTNRHERKRECTKRNDDLLILRIFESWESEAKITILAVIFGFWFSIECIIQLRKIRINDNIITTFNPFAIRLTLQLCYYCREWWNYHGCGEKHRKLISSKSLVSSLLNVRPYFNET